MSFIIAVYVNEGMVLASDSRTTYMQNTNNNGVQVQRIGTHVTDSAMKTFLCPNGVGLSTCGQADIMGIPITGYVESYIREKVKEDTPISQMPESLMDYFGKFHPVPETNFMLAGYAREGDQVHQKLYRMKVKDKNSIQEVDTSKQGASWDGESLTLTRLLQPAALKQGEGKYSDLPFIEVPWRFFSLQEAVDFARFAVDVTIRMIHFQNTPETVGGPVDILVLKPEESKWVSHKELM